MNVFVGYGYNERDSWIERLVFPLVRAFGNTVVTGGRIEGEILSEAVKERIRVSDALLGFVTRRGDRPSQDGLYPTHRWVTDELAVAIEARIPVIEIRETQVDDQGGIAGDRQRIEYDEASREQFLVELAEVLGGWAQRRSRNLRLLPPEFVQAIRPHMRRQGFRCTYVALKDGRPLPEVDALPLLVPREGGLYLMAKHVAPGTLIQIRVEAAGNSWVSEYIDLDSLSVELLAD
jgi:hypothetical protein